MATIYMTQAQAHALGRRLLEAEGHGHETVVLTSYPSPETKLRYQDAYGGNDDHPIPNIEIEIEEDETTKR